MSGVWVGGVIRLRHWANLGGSLSSSLSFICGFGGHICIICLGCVLNFLIDLFALLMIMDRSNTYIIVYCDLLIHLTVTDNVSAIGCANSLGGIVVLITTTWLGGFSPAADWLLFGIGCILRLQFSSVWARIGTIFITVHDWSVSGEAFVGCVCSSRDSTSLLLASFLVSEFQIHPSHTRHYLIVYFTYHIGIFDV